MKDLATMIKELEERSLYQFTERRNKVYSFMVLFFAPDDYHGYLGFQITGKKVTASIGVFYHDTKKQDLLFDNPTHQVVMDDQEYKKIHKSFREVDTYNKSILSKILPISATIP
jgi:tetrahydromethanopterin S-methyltransferase subunit G